MSSFTQFDGKLNISYSHEASDILGRDYWLVEKGFTYYLGHHGSSRFVVVPAGFLSDGASVPKILQFLVSTMGRHSQAAVLHDFLTEDYSILVRDHPDKEPYRLFVNRRTIDKIFYESLEVLKVPWIQRVLIRAGVDFYRFFKRPSAPTLNKDKIALQLKYQEELTS